MSAQSKRRGAVIEPVDPRQQDLFAAEVAPPPPAAMVSGPPEDKTRAKRLKRRDKAKTPAPPQGKPPPPSFVANDDWWTTRSVCAFLKIGRKALWNMRRDPASVFPAPVDAVGHRHLYLAAEVRGWMDAQRETARRRDKDRRQALAQFSTRSS